MWAVGQTAHLYVCKLSNDLRVKGVKKYQIRSKKRKICYNLVKTLKQFEGWGIMYNTYTIGELAKILGITAETIRYYERKGIIAPIHDQETGYRYYTTWDLHMLIRARCYLGFGLSIEETAGILQSKSLEEIDDLLEYFLFCRFRPLMGGIDGE